MAQKKSASEVSLEGLSFQVYFAPADLDEFIEAHGVPLVHMRSMRCPVGLRGVHDARRADDCSAGCSNGFIYTRAGVIRCVATGNSAKFSQYDPGLLVGSSIHITPPRFYSDPGLEKPRPVQLLQYDRLYLDEETITVPTWETFEAHETGVDRLRYPVVSVTDIMDSSGRVYGPGDFDVLEGRIRWRPGKGPGSDPDTGRGLVCSVRYEYRPYYYVSQLVHELRVSTVEGMDGQSMTARMPQSALLQREYVWENQDNASSVDDPRRVPSSDNGGFSAR